MLGRLKVVSTFSLILILLSCTAFKAPHEINAVTNKVETFKNKAELREYIRETKAFAKYREKERDKLYEEDFGDRIVVTGSRVTASDLPSITNNQVQGVDEGDIIKRYGEFLFILRNGSLYSIRIINNSLKTLDKVDKVDVESKNQELRKDTWFDEMLINDGVLLITGFNFEYDYTVLTRYRISDEGKLIYLNTHVITSNDYFSGTNYGSRLFDGKFISYIPFELRLDNEYLSSFPNIALIKPKQSVDKDKLDWEALIDISDIVKPSNQLEDPYVHLFIKCPINDAKIYCESSGVVGSDFPEYYISGEFAYLWLTGWKDEVLLDGEFSLDSTLVYPSSAYYYSMSGEYKGKYHNKLELFSDSKLYRISLTDFSINYFPIELEPLDQFSFHEDGGDLYMFGLNSKSTGELIKIKEHMFKGQYSPQPDVIANVTDVNDYTNNYFLLDSFVYGTMSHFGELNSTESTIINLHTGTSSTLELNHSANRFENLGEKALVVGETEDLNLGLTVIPEATPQAYQQLFLHDRLEGETRSHAFNATSINNMTIFGLTTQLKSKGEEEHNYYHWGEDVSSDITFFNWDNGVNVAGELVSKENSKDESCEVSCEDWYGNTRPFFIGDRIFGLSGDELIEAKLVESQIIEIERIGF